MRRPAGMRGFKIGEGDREGGWCDPGGELRHSVTGEFHRVCGGQCVIGKGC